MKLALITLSSDGARVTAELARTFDQADCYIHEKAEGPGKTFARVAALTEELFETYEGLVYVAPCGVVVRAIAPCLASKLTDPAVVVVDVGARHVISLLSGHEGGANALAFEVANRLGAEPVISTTTEAAKTLIVGVGCRRGIPAESLEAAIGQALEKAAAQLADVRCLATADLKAREPGLIEVAQKLGIPLRIISSDEIRACTRAFAESDFVKEKVNLPAVAEPAALLAGRRTTLLLPKTAYNGVTVAIAREDCFSLVSDPVER